MLLRHEVLSGGRLYMDPASPQLDALLQEVYQRGCGD